MPQRLRISGLVRLANSVRDELASPLSISQRQRLRERVAGELRQVQSILNQYGAQERELPQPSVRALQFLRQIDWERVALPPDTSAGAKPPPTRISFPWMSAFLERTLQRLSSPLTADEIESVRQNIEKMSRQVEAVIGRYGERARLADASLAGLAWLAFFAERDNLHSYQDIQRIATPIFTAAARTGPCKMPIKIHFRPVNGIYKYRSTPGGTIVSLPTPMISFDETALNALSRMMFSRDRSQRKAVVAAMLAEDYQTVRAELESLGGLIEQPRGAFYDLAEIFNHVNAQFFDGRMARPRLAWSRSFTGRKFGHYDFLRDTVMVTSSLDRPDIPKFVVNYIMYHELLHKKHGTRWKNGRGYAHTPAFYAEERRFPEYHKADAIIKRIARGQSVDLASAAEAGSAR